MRWRQLAAAAAAPSSSSSARLPQLFRPAKGNAKRPARLPLLLPQARRSGCGGGGGSGGAQLVFFFCFVKLDSHRRRRHPQARVAAAASSSLDRMSAAQPQSGVGMSSTASAVQGESAAVKQKKDPAWKYCTRTDANKTNSLRCNFCDNVYTNGITRIKFHLAHIPTCERILAMRILSLTCSSSPCERNFSVFQQIHTKRRSRLLSNKLRDLVFIKFNSKLTQKREMRDYDPLDDTTYADVVEDEENEWITGVVPVPVVPIEVEDDEPAETSQGHRVSHPRKRMLPVLGDDDGQSDGSSSSSEDDANDSD